MGLYLEVVHVKPKMKVSGVDDRVLARTWQYGRQTAIGIGVYLNVFEDSLAQLAESRLPAPSNGALPVGQSLYSYAATNKVTSGVPHRPHAEFFRALSEDGAYTPEAPYGEAAGIPVMPWKKHPQRGSLLAQVIDTDGAPADGASITLEQIAEDILALPVEGAQPQP